MRFREILIFLVGCSVTLWLFIFGIEHYDYEPPAPIANRYPAITQIPATQTCKYIIDHTNQICWLQCFEAVQMISKYEGCTTLLSRTKTE